jgi:phage tail-like protein
MASTSTDTHPVTPFLTYNFLVKWDNQYVAAVTRVSGLTKKTEVVSFRAGGQPQTTFKIPGQTDYEPIVLERGITTDPAFEQWANKMWYYPNTAALGQQVSLADFRKNIQLELYNQAGQLVVRYNLYYCWPSQFTALPELASDANAVALASLTLEHEGWDRDTSVTAPTLPSFTQPGS